MNKKKGSSFDEENVSLRRIRGEGGGRGIYLCYFCIAKLQHFVGFPTILRALAQSRNIIMKFNHWENSKSYRMIKKKLKNKKVFDKLQSESPKNSKTRFPTTNYKKHKINKYKISK